MKFDQSPNSNMARTPGPIHYLREPSEMYLPHILGSLVTSLDSWPWLALTVQRFDIGRQCPVKTFAFDKPTHISRQSGERSVTLEFLAPVRVIPLPRIVVNKQQQQQQQKPYTVTYSIQNTQQSRVWGLLYL